MDGFIDFFLYASQIALCAAISSLPLFLIVGCITLAGRRWMSARSRFALWTLVLIRMVLPFSWETPFGLGMLTNRFETVKSDPAHPLQDLAVDTPLDTSFGLYEAGQSSTAIAANAWSLQDWTSLILAIGFSAVSFSLAVWFVVTSYRLAYRVRRGTSPHNPLWNELLDRGRREFGIRVPVRLRILSQWKTPATMGFFRPVIILPDDAETLTDVEMQHVIWHELAHVKRGDSAWNALWLAARCLQWWNPCFLWTQHSWLAERELACDVLVMQHLDPSVAPDYGRTIIRFLERLSDRAGVPRTFSVPGLVMIVGDKWTIRRRLKALAHPTATETSWGRWCSFGLLAALGATGLTDAMTPTVEVPALKSVSIPAGTVWQFGSDEDINAADTESSTTTRVYDVSTALVRLHNDEPQVPEQSHLRDLDMAIRTFLPGIARSPTSGRCQIDGHQFIVTATDSQHRSIEKVLSQWQEFGLQQISVRVHMMSTDSELSDVLPFGGQIVSPSPVQEIDLLTGQTAKLEVRNSLSGPSFVRVLSSQERTAAVNFFQQRPRDSLLFAPTVTTFAGIPTVLSSFSKVRPFVTGLRSNQDGTQQPQISHVKEGVQFEIKRYVHDSKGSIDLNIRMRTSEILDVEVLRTTVPGQSKETAIQIPHVRQSTLQTSVTLAKDESYLISPLRRDKQGKLQVYVITPTLIDLASFGTK